MATKIVRDGLACDPNSEEYFILDMVDAENR